MRSVIPEINIDRTIGGFTANYFINELYINSHHFRYEIINNVYNPVQRYLNKDLCDHFHLILPPWTS